MRKLMMLAALAAALMAFPVHGQTTPSTPMSALRPQDLQTSGTVTAASTCGTTGFAGGTSCVEMYAVGMGSALVTLGGGFTSTHAFQVQNAGGIWVSATAYPISGGTPVTSATSPGSWLISMVGVRGVRTNCSAFTSTPTINIDVSPQRLLPIASAGAVGAQAGDSGLLVTGPGEWTVNHTPAVSTQAVASKASGGSGVRRVGTSCSGSISTIAAQTNITLSLRDGATGAGTVLWSQTVICAITTPCTLSSPRLNAVGTAATAMTCEWSGAPATNNFAVATLTGYDVR